MLFQHLASLLVVLAGTSSVRAVPVASASSSVSSATASSSTSSATPSSSTASSATSSATSSAPVSSSSTAVPSSVSSEVASSVSSAASSTITSSAVSSSTSSAAATTTPWSVPSGWAVAPVPCIAEGTTGRALSYLRWTDPAMTIEKCLDYCGNQGLTLAGLEFSNECYCGGVLGNGASLSRASDSCNMNCAGLSTEKCGGSGVLSLYVSTSASGLSSDYTSVAASPPTGWNALGCYKEGTTGRALDGWSYTGVINVATCMNYCRSKGFSLAGLENGNECWCDNAFRNGAGASSTACTTPCNGGPGQNCGGQNALQVYQNPSLAPSATSSNGYTKQTCIQEVANRALTSTSIASNTMTVDTCTAYCKTGGYRYAGLEYGRECYCGNVLSNGASLDKYSSQCNMGCSGSSKVNCGGPNAINLFALT